MNQKVMVIGGAGFVGSHLVDACLAEGWQVTVYDNFSRGRREFLPARPGLDVIEGDILETADLKSAMAAVSPDVVFHLAAIHFIPECEEHPARALRVNVEGTQSVLDAIRDSGAHLVFTSTGAIYDPDITDALNETSGIRTADIYGITKHTAEGLVHYHVAKERGTAVIARLFNAVGTRETNAHLIPAIMDQLAQGERRIELGNLYPRRDYIHVQDIAEALVSLVRMPRAQALETFNVGSGVEYSVGELLEISADVIGEPIHADSVAARRRKYDRPSQLADIGRIRSRANWAPKRDLRAALRDVWQEITVGSI